MLIDLVCYDAGKLIRDADRLIVTHRQRASEVSIPPGQSCFLPTWITLSPGARNTLCAAGSDIIHARGPKATAHWQSSRGPQATLLENRRAQYAVFEASTAQRAWTRYLIGVKIAGQMELVRSCWRRHDHFRWQRIMARMKTARLRLGQNLDVERARALEGEASAAYFEAWRDLLNAPTFRRRPRQSLCPVNLLADTYYAHLTGVIDAHVRARGFDPHYGSLHPPRGDRPSLALDLIEPLRPRIVDRLLLNLACNRDIKSWMIEKNDHTWTFTADGRRKALARWKTWFYGGKRRPGQIRWLAHVLGIWHDWLQSPQRPPRSW